MTGRDREPTMCAETCLDGIVLREKRTRPTWYWASTRTMGQRFRQFRFGDDLGLVAAEGRSTSSVSASRV